MDPVVYFEVPYDNRERMAKFYESAFGWQTQMLGEDMGNHVLATASACCSPSCAAGMLVSQSKKTAPLCT